MCQIRSVYPIRKLSTSAAASLPSETAQTTSDCPLLMSPAVKTFGTDVRWFPSEAGRFPRASLSSPNAVQTLSDAPVKPAAIISKPQSCVFSVPGISFMTVLPVASSLAASSDTVMTAESLPPSPEISFLTVV